MFIEVKLTESSMFRETILNTNHIVHVSGSSAYMSNGNELPLQEESLKKVLLSISTKTKGVKNKEPDQDMLEYFSELHKLTGGKGKPIFNLKREKQLKTILDMHGMNKEKLRIAATNIGEDEFLQGKSEDNTKRYGDIDYLLRPDKAVKWAEATPKKKKGMF